MLRSDGKPLPPDPLTKETKPVNDATYGACLAYLNAKGYVLWGDYSLNPNNNDDGTPKNRPAARWLEAQVRGVADHYDTPDNPAPPYAGPYSSERNGGGQRP